MIGFRADDATRAAIVKWAENQSDKPTLSDAIRQLVELGLSSAQPRAQTTAKTADKAKELATETINHLIDPQASNEEKASRKGRLIKGPEEFREVRIDRPKKK